MGCNGSDDIDVGRVAMNYLGTYIPCFKRIACRNNDMTFVELRNVFASFCNLSSDRPTDAHAYGVTSFDRHGAYKCSDVQVASALLNSIVRHELQYHAHGGATVTHAIRDALKNLTHGDARPSTFYNPFDVHTVLFTSLDHSSNEVRSAAALWLTSIESAGIHLRSVSARRIARAITKSTFFSNAMERGYAPGGRIFNVLKAAYDSGL